MDRDLSTLEESEQIQLPHSTQNRSPLVKSKQLAKKIAGSTALASAEHLSLYLARKRATTPTPASCKIVFVAWDQQRTYECISALRSVVSRLHLSWSDDLVVVRNRNIQIPTDCTVVDGSNKHGEFSGYDEGIEFLNDRYPSQTPACWLLANDRLLSYKNFDLAVVSSEVISLAASSPMMIGVVDNPPLAKRILGGTLPYAYCRTNALIVNGDVIEKQRTLVSIADGEFDNLVPIEYPGDGWQLHQSAELPNGFASWVHGWLTGNSDAVSHSWYAAQPLSAETWETFRTKVRAIINEHRLSLRMQESNVALLPIAAATAVSLLQPDGNARAKVLCDAHANATKFARASTRRTFRIPILLRAISGR